MEIVPSGVLRQLVVAFGAALLISSAAVIVREVARRKDPQRQRPNWIVVGVNVACGIAMLIWGIASLVVAG